MPKAVIEPGMRVGAYRLLQRVGGGAFSQVWKAEHVSTGRLAALKISDRDKLHAPPELEHPNVVRVLEARPDDDPPHLVLELVEGPSLRERMARGPLPFEEAADIARGILSGLAAAHERGIAHRDLKPENVLLGAVPKVTDFGASRTIAPDELARSIEMPEPLVLTLAYMAPELREGRGGITSDVYSFGVILYEMLTGTLPVGAFRYPSELFPEVPAAIDDVLRRCLEPAPGQRWAHAMELSRAFDAAREAPIPRLPLDVRGVHEIQTVHELVDYALGSPEQWEEIKILKGLPDWLRAIRRFDLARRADEDRSDEGLERLLEATGYFHAPELDVDVDAGRLDLGALPHGPAHAFRLRAIKRGRGYLSAAARTGSPILEPKERTVRLAQIDHERSDVTLEWTLKTAGLEVYREYLEPIDVGSRRVVVRFTVEPREAELEIQPGHVTILVGGGERSATVRVCNRGDRTASVRAKSSEPWLKLPEEIEIPPGASRPIRLAIRALPRTDGMRADAQVEFEAAGRLATLSVTAIAVRRFDLGLFLLGLFAGFVPVLGEILFVAALVQAAAPDSGSDPVRRITQRRSACSFLIGLLPGLVAQLIVLL